MLVGGASAGCLVPNPDWIGRDTASQMRADLGGSELNKTDVFPER